MITQQHLILLLVLSAAKKARSFSTHVSLVGTRGVRATSALRAGFATEGYLNSLNELAGSSSAFSTEDYLSSLARLRDVSGTPSFGQSAVDFGSFNLASKIDSLSQDFSGGLNIADSASASFDYFRDDLSKLSNGLANAGSAGSAQINNLFEGVADASSRLIAKGGSALQETLDLGGNKLAEEGSALIAATGQVRLVDIENSVVSGLLSVGSTFINILDYVALTFGGSTVSDLLASAQASVNGVVNGAIQSAVQTVHGIGDITLAQIVKSLAILITTVAKVLFQILSIVIKAVSGKSISEWSVDVKGYVVQETSKLMAQASATASDLNEKSLSELADAIGSFSNHVVTLAAESVTTISGLIESSGDPLAGALAYNSADTASHLSSFMTNL
uniref:Uncharacterized protein n=1 Tax=Ditylum brightwellii TaxID=49249 RepID=A0A7S2A6X4_9STRA|mmetsp:Transcript_9154/g.13607  ORF Transcript_9154/g.13607 Transcript_9154/m.13607 type:complete len:390 (+) Transcript_9154:147-1316(+)